MLRPSYIAAVWLAVVISIGASTRVNAIEEYAFFHEHILGTSLELRIKAENLESARHAETKVLREIERLAKIFNGYVVDSEFSRWQATHDQSVAISRELFEVLARSDHWSGVTAGGFDPRVEVLSRLWANCGKRNALPTSAELKDAQAVMTLPAWSLDQGKGTATRTSNCPLTLNAIAKGYIVDKACDAALAADPGVRGVMTCIGGDLCVKGDLSRRIGIADPRHDSETSEPLGHVELKDNALATSGSSQRGMLIDGEWYSHIFDPRTCQPIRRVLCATVIAPTAIDADALATSFCVLPVEECLRIAETLPGVACLIVGEEGRVYKSRRWDRFEKVRPRLVSFFSSRSEPQASEAPAKSPWNPNFEMLVRFEINQPPGSGRGLRRPYVSVWVEDKDGLPVRTLILWVQKNGPGPRWIPDLKRWYRNDQVRKLVDEADLVETISRPTRPPGKYEAIWDGKDDHGKRLDAGDYTICVEAAREHGTYQIIRKQVMVKNEPFVEELKGNVEIKSAAIEYRTRKSDK